jgi:hypothetical protein
MIALDDHGFVGFRQNFVFPNGFHDNPSFAGRFFNPQRSET